MADVDVEHLRDAILKRRASIQQASDEWPDPIDVRWGYVPTVFEEFIAATGPATVIGWLDADLAVLDEHRRIDGCPDEWLDLRAGTRMALPNCADHRPQVPGDPVTDVLPPFPTDPQMIDLLNAAVRPGRDAERSSVNELCMLMTDLSGVTQNPDDPWCYHPNDITAALIDEIRRLREELA